MENLIYQIIQLISNHQDGNDLGLTMVSTLVANWEIGGCLWISGIDPHNQNDSHQVIAGTRQAAILLSDESAIRILRQPIIQSILNQEGEAIPQEFSQFELETLDISMTLASSLGIRTQLQGVVNGLLIVGYDSPHSWTMEERNRLTIVSPLLAIATRLQAIHEEQAQLNRQRNDIATRLQAIHEEQAQLNRQRNDMWNNIIAKFSDQARNPLTAIPVAVTLLRRPDLPPDRQERYLDILMQAFCSLEEIVNSIG